MFDILGSSQGSTGTKRCMLSDWPYFLKVDILYLILCLEGHLSNLISHFYRGAGCRRGCSLCCWEDVDIVGGGVGGCSMLKCAVESHTCCWNFSLSLGHGRCWRGGCFHACWVCFLKCSGGRTKHPFWGILFEPISGLNTLRLCYDFHGATSVFLLKSHLLLCPANPREVWDILREITQKEQGGCFAEDVLDDGEASKGLNVYIWFE